MWQACTTCDKRVNCAVAPWVSLHHPNFSDGWEFWCGVPQCLSREFPNFAACQSACHLMRHPNLSYGCQSAYNVMTTAPCNTFYLFVIAIVFTSLWFNCVHLFVIAIVFTSMWLLYCYSVYLFVTAIVFTSLWLRLCSSLCDCDCVYLFVIAILRWCLPLCDCDCVHLFVIAIVFTSLWFLLCLPLCDSYCVLCDCDCVHLFVIAIVFTSLWLRLWVHATHFTSWWLRLCLGPKGGLCCHAPFLQGLQGWSHGICSLTLPPLAASFLATATLLLFNCTLGRLPGLLLGPLLLLRVRVL
jgi:hypothetical protein